MPLICKCLFRHPYCARQCKLATSKRKYTFLMWLFFHMKIDGLVQNCSISIANVLDLHYSILALNHQNDNTTLLWRNNGPVSVSNHQPHDCLLNRLFRRRSKNTSKLRVTGLCAGNSPGTGEFPAHWPATRKCFHLMTSSWWEIDCGTIVTFINILDYRWEISQHSVWCREPNSHITYPVPSLRMTNHILTRTYKK